MGDITERVQELERDYERLDAERINTISVLRKTAGSPDTYGLRAHAVAAAERIKTLQDKLAEKVDTSNEDYLRYLKRLNAIDEMLNDAFPGDTATIEARVAAACTNTKLLEQAQTDLAAVQRARAALASQLDRERRLHGEYIKDLLKAKKDRDYFQDTSGAQRERAQAVEKDLAVALKRAEQAEKDRGYWQRMCEDNGAALAAAEEKLRRLRHEDDPFVQIQEAAMAGKSFNVAGGEYVPADQYSRDHIEELKRLARDGKDIVIEGRSYTPTSRIDWERVSLQQKLNQIARLAGES